MQGKKGDLFSQSSETIGKINRPKIFFFFFFVFPLFFLALNALKRLKNSRNIFGKKIMKKYIRKFGIIFPFVSDDWENNSAKKIMIFFPTFFF